MKLLSSEQIGRIRRLALAFRRAIERCRSELTYVVFKNFPHGACGDTCDLLGRFYAQMGIGGWEYVSGRFDQQTHAWLEKDGWIVDITADQFDDAPDSVLVTNDRSWHQRFQVKCRRPCGATGCPDEIAGELEATYETIIRHVDVDELAEEG